jgi:hypothetical protein
MQIYFGVLFDYQMVFFYLLPMSHVSPKRPRLSALHMSAFWGKAVMTFGSANVSF